jgi:beta-1,4-mannosyl-glycoprotein beta-1,4-N-acetylglucosaminyltransferase
MLQMLGLWSIKLMYNTICVELFYFALVVGCFEYHVENPGDQSVVEHNLIPRIVVKSPGNYSTVNLPFSFRYVSTGACISEVYIDGISLFRGAHTKDNDFAVNFTVPYLSYETHHALIDIVDSEGNLLEAGIVSLNFHVSADSVGDTEDHYDEVEPTDVYDPNLSEEDKARAVLKDGWLLIHQNIEFTRIEPIDSCEDMGWTKRKIPRKIYDAFQFFNELDILEIRLHELQNVVHRFILIEATRTHSNQLKPLYYELNKQRFAQFHSKILHLIVEDLPNSTDPWVLENFQRNAILRGLSGAHPNDLVVIADVDEIPASYVLDAVRSCDGPTSPTWLYTRFFNFKFEWEFLGQWKHPQVVRFANLIPGAAGSVTPQQVRMGAMTPRHTKIESAGWHCSFFTDAEGVIQKVKAFTHQELNRAVGQAPMMRDRMNAAR